jgi:glycogenin glucosyltransferase
MEAWVTLATNDAYAIGALVLGRSLRRVQTAKKLVVMITPGVSQEIRESLSRIFDAQILVDPYDSGDETNLALIGRPDLGVTFTKLHCWRLTSYKKCVFLDADTLVLENCDELFDRPELAAAPDIGWPDCFNSGVFVFVPSQETYEALLRCAVTLGTFDGGDQGLLNIFFNDWYSRSSDYRLPFMYNMSSSSAYSYTAAYKYFGKNVKIVHFLGTVKPWHHSYDETAGGLHVHGHPGHAPEHLEQWWSLFVREVSPLISQDALDQLPAGIAALKLADIERFHATCTSGSGSAWGQGGPSEDSSGGGSASQGTQDQQQSYDEFAHQRAWEAGVIDFTGRDSFENIQKRLTETLERHTSPPK